MSDTPRRRHGGPGPMMSEKMEKGTFRKSLVRLFSSLNTYWLMMIIASVFIVGSVLISIFAPQVLSDLSDEIANNAASKNIDTDKIFSLGITLILLYAVSALCSYASGFIMTTISQRYSQKQRSQIIKKINAIPLRYFDSTATGDLLSRVTNDVDTIGQSLQQSLSMLISSVFTLVGAVIAMLITCPQMALVCILSIPVMIVALAVVLGLSGPKFRRRQEYMGVVDGIVEENYNALLVVKAFNAEKKIQKQFDGANEELRKAFFGSEVFGGLMQPIMSLMSYLDYAAVCITGGLLMNAGTAGVTFGTITAFLVYVNLFQSPLSQIAQAMNQLQSGVAASKRVFDFLDEKELEDESTKKHFFEVKDGKKQVKGAVTFDHVSFGYDESREIIHDFSCEVKPGMKVAIVGPTGAGKTTMVNLLMRFYEVTKGRILIDGVDIKDMSREEIHDIFGMVLQDTWVFEGTVRENLVYNTENVSQERLDRIVRHASLTHYVETLPGNYEYYIKDDAALSGGQKQLITIARAMIEKSPLMILDEATSNVDTRTEETIQDAMDYVTKGKTSFVIAHRLSTIRNADLILVMRDGNIVEQGNHEELMKQNGFYASLYNSQFALE